MSAETRSPDLAQQCARGGVCQRRDRVGRSSHRSPGHRRCGVAGRQENEIQSDGGALAHEAAVHDAAGTEPAGQPGRFGDGADVPPTRTGQHAVGINDPNPAQPVQRGAQA